MSKSITKNLIFNTLLQVSNVIFPLITAPYIARVLDPDGVGECNFISSYVGYFILFSSLGMSTYAIREAAKFRDDLAATTKLVSQLITFKLILTSIVTTIFLLSVFLVPQFNSDKILFLVGGFGLYLSPFSVSWVFNAKEEFGFVTIRSLIIKVLSVIFTFVCVRTRNDVIIYILIGAISSVASEIWNYIYMFRMGIKPKLWFNGCFTHFKGIITLFAAQIAISIYTMLDTLMLGLLSSYSQVGYYSSSMHIVKALLALTTSLSAVALPRVSYLMNSSKTEEINQLMNKSLGFVSLLAFPIMIGVIMTAPVFAPLFFGSEFYGAILPMQIGAGVIVAIGLNNLNGVQILIGIGKDKLFLISVVTGAITNFILNLILIPPFGAAGAASSSVFAELLILFVNEYLMRRHSKIRVTNYSDMLKAIVGSILIIPTCLAVRTILSGWIYITTCVVLASVLYFSFEKITRNTTLNYAIKFVVPKFIKTR